MSCGLLCPFAPSSASFSRQRASPVAGDGCVLRGQPLRSGYVVAKRSALRAQSRTASQFESSGGAYTSDSSSPVCSRNAWGGRLLRPAAGPSGIVGVLSRDGSSCGDAVRSPRQRVQRRELVRGISSWIALPGLMSAASAPGAAAAEDDGRGPESSTEAAAAAPAKTLVERLLERTKANKARYDAERLDAYYRRNFKDYFDFLKGGILNKDVDKLTETDKGILRWLEKNK